MIHFSKHIKLYLLLSALVIVPGLFSLFRFGMKQSIDFTGGTLIEIQVPPSISRAALEKTASEVKMSLVGVQKTTSGSYLLRAKPEGGDKSQVFLQTLLKESGEHIVLLRNEIVGPVLGAELLRKALIAAALAVTGILLYVAYAFRNVDYGVAAIVALLHDLLVVIGTFSLFGHFLGVEVDTLFVTAVLTTMSFSVHDTIVVFDRIREMNKKGVRGSFEELADTALTETISRSTANSATIIIMLLSLVLLGGETVKWFAVALLIGTVSGTYSSPFIATPVLILIKRWRKKRK